MDFQAPEELQKPINHSEKLLMAAGPSNSYPRALEALSKPTMGVIQPEMFQIMDEIKAGIKYLFQTKNPLTFVLSTSGNGGAECVFVNLLQPGETIIIARSGFWGDRAVEIAGYHDIKVVRLSPRRGLGHGFSNEELEAAIREHNPKVLYIVHGESSIGLLQPLEGLGDICHQYDCLLAVDGVASVGGTPMFMDRWNIDVLFTGSQKVLGMPPGLAPISFSSRALEVINNRRVPVSTFWYDAKYYARHWDCLPEQTFMFHHTLETSLLCALRECLAIVAEEGLEELMERHRVAVQYLYKGLEKLGLEFFIEDESERLPCVTAMRVPEGINNQDVMKHMMEKYGIEIGFGFNEMRFKMFRFGVMGHNARIETVRHFLECLEKSLEFVRNSPNLSK